MAQEDKNNEIFLGRHPKRLERLLMRGGSLREAATVAISPETVWCFGSRRSLYGRWSLKRGGLTSTVFTFIRMDRGAC